MFLAEAGLLDLDTSSFSWLVFTRQVPFKPNNMYNAKHKLILNKGDLFGIKGNRKGFQLIKADALHITFRFPEKVHNAIMEHAKPYRGAIPQVELDAGYVRARKVDTAPKLKATRLRTDDYFKPEHKVIEASELDYENYQWRKVNKPTIHVESKRAGKTKTVLHTGDIVGLRYVNPSIGGYVIHDDDKRVMISHEMYDHIKNNSRCLPLTQQRKGIVDLPTGKVLKKQDRASKNSIIVRRPRDTSATPIIPRALEDVIVPKYDIKEVSDVAKLHGDRRRLNTANRIKNVVNNVITKIPDLEDWDENIGYDDTENHSDGRPADIQKEMDTPIDLEQDAKQHEKPVKFKQDDDEDENLPKHAVEDLENEVADQLQPGTIFKAGKREFVVVDAHEFERNDNLMEYFLYEVDSEDDEFYRIRLPVAFTMREFEKVAEIMDKTYPTDKLAKLQTQAEFATFKSISLVK